MFRRLTSSCSIDLPSAGAGEASIVCVAPAIGSAVRAFGTVDTALPIRLANRRV
jgi:CO/xanthine dehydrogenase Mo-binding subunit